MGICLNYSGSIKPEASLTELVEEVRDIAEANNWEYHIYETEFPEGSLLTDTYNKHVYGIHFTPDQCETVFISFLSNGRISSYVNLEFYGNSAKPAYQKYLYYISVKTQYAGPEVHMTIVYLLKYLNQKYFKTFEMHDEGQFWETEDKQKLKENFKRLGLLLDNLAFALDTQTKEPDESLEDFILRLAKGLNKKDDNNL